jgi:hypothetical protein
MQSIHVNTSNISDLVSLKNFKILSSSKFSIKNYRYNKIIRINKHFFFIFISKYNKWYLYSIKIRKFIKFNSSPYINYVNYPKVTSFMIRPFIYFTNVDQYENSILAHQISSIQFSKSYNQFTNMEKTLKNYSSTFFFI